MFLKFWCKHKRIIIKFSLRPKQRRCIECLDCGRTFNISKELKEATGAFKRIEERKIREILR